MMDEGGSYAPVVFFIVGIIIAVCIVGTIVEFILAFFEG